MTPDVAVYLGAATRLMQGVLPYRDFVFVQPPGSVLLLSPFGALAHAIGTRDALAVLRLTEPLLAAGCVLLAARALRRWGSAASLAGGAVVAVFPAELYALRGPMLEPWLVLLGLAAAVLLVDGRAGWAGVLLGAALSLKLTALLLVLAGAALALRRLQRYLAGVAAGFAAICLPFAAAAPQAFAADVFVQLSRVHAGAPFYPQYPAVLAPPVALAAGLAMAWIRPPAPVVAAAAAAVLLLTGLSVRDLSAQDVARAVDAAIPPGACVVTDSPRLTVTTDRFLSSRRDCSKLVDPFGTALVHGRGSAAWREAVAHADYLLSDHALNAGAEFQLRRTGRLWIYARTG